MSLTRDDLITELEKRYPKQTFRTSEEFNGSEGGVWTSGEDCGQLHAGLPLFNYYSQDGGSESYVFGIRTFLHEWLEENGWYCEWYDAGTIIIYEI